MVGRRWLKGLVTAALHGGTPKEHRIERITLATSLTGSFAAALLRHSGTQLM